ncbi:uncharacterized flavoproteins [Longilinea arvoryzae]|uniref:Uncharacterized flavoproteins n=1 Tax=Longilinea arvoryzae TaxID=360412 RepID=A0A0S7B6R9_9CHLR|nr:flavodoxin domain-containing protein [Longilinea arvoryzae]GAP12895.1 uncharacterized flavoproteins [Longilinea arvoryzae]
MKKTIKNNVSWVGKVDWELESFEGEELSTTRGSSYNAYLIQEEKNVLVDTVWTPFSEEFIENLAQEIDLDKIDTIVANHGEVDHSGALTALMKRIPNTPIYCTEFAVKSLKGQYHQDWNFHPVKTGDRLPIGNGKELVFIEMQMLHWPDSMATYLTQENILFSMDVFGEHLATDKLFNDLVNPYVLQYEGMKYYANIINRNSPTVIKKIEMIQSLGLPIDIIAPSHGVVWRDHPMQIVDRYLEWANGYQENQITIIYDTMWGTTRKAAEKIAEGIAQADPTVTIKLFNLSKSDENNLIVEVFKSKTVLIGSPTFCNSALHTTVGFVYFMKSLKFLNKKAAAFGCYGWSGEAAKELTEMLKDAGFEVIDEGFRNKWDPDDERQLDAIEYGKKIALA